MHVHIRLSKFYDWDPIPKGVVVTEQDIAAGKVMPGRDGAYRMRVVKIPVGGMTKRTCHISEGTLVEKIIEEKSDVRKKAGRTLTRHEAVAHLIADQLLEGAAEWDWILGFDVEVDDGPSEELMRAKLAPHTTADHGRRLGRKNVPPEHVEDHVAAYLGQFKPLPKASFADPEKPTTPEMETHIAAAKPIRADNHKALEDHLHSHFGVKRG